MNTLTIDEKSRIWVPRIVFNNTDDENESVVDAKTRVVVVRKVGRKAIFIIFLYQLYVRIMDWPDTR